MPITTFNKAKSIVNSDAYNLAADLLTLASSLPVTIPVASQAERDGLAALAPGGVLPIPTFVMRTDLQSYPTFRWDGSTWTQTSGLKHAEYTGPAFTTTGGTGTNFSNGTGGTVFSVDAAKTFNNDFVQPDVGGRVKTLTAGVYAFSGIILPTGVPASFSLQINDVTNSVVLGSVAGVGYGNKEESVTSPNTYLAANTVVEFTLVTSNAITLGSRIKITKAQ